MKVYSAYFLFTFSELAATYGILEQVLVPGLEVKLFICSDLFFLYFSIPTEIPCCYGMFIETTMKTTMLKQVSINGYCVKTDNVCGAMEPGVSDCHVMGVILCLLFLLIFRIWLVLNSNCVVKELQSIVFTSIVLNVCGPQPFSRVVWDRQCS